MSESSFFPLRPSHSEEMPLMAYAEQLASEAHAHFRSYAQEHICILRQRRYANGELVEVNTVHFASPDLTREEVLALLKEATDNIKSGAGFAFAHPDAEADPTAMMMAPSLESADYLVSEEAESEVDEDDEDDEDDEAGEDWKN